MRNRRNEDLEVTAVKMMAAATATPFKSAFMAMMGIFAAQLVGLLLFIGTVLTIGFVIYLVGK